MNKVTFLKSYFKTCMTTLNLVKRATLNNRSLTMTFLLFSSCTTNISSLQTHFDDFKEFLSNFSHPPSLILISETRIHLNPILNIEIPNYTFTHVPSPTGARGVMAYVLKELNFTVNDRLSLNIDGCEDLWLDVDIPGLKNNYTFAVIYRHPWNNHSTFLEALYGL